MGAFTVLNSDGLTELPQGVFGDVSFQYIDVYDAWNLMTIHPEAILQSKDRLQGLHIYGGILHDFPWYIVPQLTNITSLGISSNALTTVPVLESSALQYLFLGENHISTLEVGWNTPNLNYLDLSYNPISELPTGFFDGLENIVAFDCISCKLGPILAAGSMEFPGATLEYLYLFHNNITFVEPGAITGLTAHAHLDLWGNEIEELTEESFRPILEDLSLGNGHIDLFACEEPSNRAGPTLVVLNGNSTGLVVAGIAENYFAKVATSNEDDERNGRPSTSRNEATLGPLAELVHSDRSRSIITLVYLLHSFEASLANFAAMFLGESVRGRNSHTEIGEKRWNGAGCASFFQPIIGNDVSSVIAMEYVGTVPFDPNGTPKFWHRSGVPRPAYHSPIQPRSTPDRRESHTAVTRSLTSSKRTSSPSCSIATRVYERIEERIEHAEEEEIRRHLPVEVHAPARVAPGRHINHRGNAVRQPREDERAEDVEGSPRSPHLLHEVSALDDGKDAVEEIGQGRMMVG
ncbi:unnamed protein product [Darwinula stevensoni]|uniref:Uncharacterized protein n=1 Tax=Darwinula stevensoni TaxID=69355 RepID=A0A7R9A7K1_9CRUS|nr:unnamed protein product [Darwinula stevensoni]CAG0893760.1 unnamed protein product [Darwinula stevensoni]